MKISIRWKLILSISVPLLIIYVAILVFDYVQLRDAAYADMQERVMQLASYQAERFDARFRALAQIPQSTAYFLTTREQLRPPQLYQILRTSLRRNPLAHAVAMAFESDGVPLNGVPFAPRVWRSEDGFQMADLGRAFDYGSDEWQRFAGEPSREKPPVWTEPFYSQRSRDELMCSHVAPIYRDGKFQGVVTIDVELERLQKEIGLDNGAFAILSRKGTFITHPTAEFVMKKTVFEWADESGLPDLKAAGLLALGGQTGVVRLASLPGVESQGNGDGHHWIAFAPIRSTQWVYAAAIPESVVMQPILTRLWRRGVFLISGLFMIIAVIMIVSIRMSKPIEQMASAVHDLSEGNLDTKVTAKTHDEIGELATGFNEMVTQLKTHVESLKQETAEREKVESELRVARDIQTFLLPGESSPATDHEQFDLHAINVPARQVAGDFYDYFLTDEKTLNFLIADVSGKGVPAALMMAVTSTVIRNLGRTGMSPAQILNQANATLAENNPDSMFVTVFLAQYDITTGRLVYANAGHLPPWAVGPSNGVRQIGGGTGPLLGVIDEGPTDLYKEEEFQLEVDDTLVLFTDGIPEARDPEGKFFGDQGLEQLLDEQRNASVEELCNYVVGELYAFQGGQPSDDVTLMVLRRNK